MTTRPLTPKQRHRRNREEMTEAILTIAREIMREEGAAALNLHEIARRIGIKTPSLYAYFPSKMAIYDALFRQGFLIFAERMNENLQNIPPGLAQLHDAIEAYMLFANENPELYQIMFERPVPGFEPSPESMAISLSSLSRGREAATQAIQSMKRPPDLTAVQINDLVIAMMHGLTSLHQANEPHLPVGEGRFGSLIPAAAQLFKEAWGLEESEQLPINSEQ